MEPKSASVLKFSLWNKNVIIVFGVILLVGLSRVFPHPWNFSPLTAMAIFGGAALPGLILKTLLPLVVIWMSDVMVNNILYSGYFNGFVWFYDGFYWQYGTYLLISLLSGILINPIRFRFTRIIITSIASSVLFFMITNLGVWIGGSLYPKTWQGLIQCYVAALPFFKGTLAGDVFYTSVFFGLYYLIFHFQGIRERILR